MRADIERGAARIEETTGRPIERYRPPYGIFNAAALAIVHRRGWRPLLWTHWGRDWQARATPSRSRSGSSAAPVAEGSVLLLHDADDYSAPGSWRKTAAALPGVLAELERARPAAGRSTSERAQAPTASATGGGARSARTTRAVARREGDVAPRDRLGRGDAGARSRRSSTPRCTIRISSSAKAAPRQRRTPPPNGIQA